MCVYVGGVSILFLLTLGSIEIPHCFITLITYTGWTYLSDYRHKSLKTSLNQDIGCDFK